MFDFLCKAEDVASRWFGSGYAPQTSMDHRQQSQDPSHDWRMPAPAAGPQSLETMDALSRLFAGYSDAESHPQGHKIDSSGNAQQQTGAGAALTGQDVVAALATATGKKSKSEAAIRQAFLGLGKDPESAKRFSQDLVAGLKQSPENGRGPMALLIEFRDMEAHGGSQELFAAYDQVIHSLAQVGTELPAEEDAYSLNYKGKQDFRGTPIKVAQQNESHATFVRTSNLESVKREASMAAENDPVDHDQLQSGNLTGPLFQNGVSYSDVRQGGLNDCFFVASMSAVAHQRPDIIQNAISQEEKFPDGTLPPPGQTLYGVTFHLKGEDEAFRPVKIFVTSRVATRKAGGVLGYFTHQQAAFAHASNSEDMDKAEAWPLIYEKAYAKFLGSYRAINKGGQGAEGLEAITGRQVREINPKKSSDEQTFQFLSTVMKNNYPTVANTIDVYGPTRADGRSEHDLEDGLVSGHQYTVLGVRREGSAIFVRVRNPWGVNGKQEGNGEQEVTIEKFKQFFNGVSSAG